MTLSSRRAERRRIRVEWKLFKFRREDGKTVQRRVQIVRVGNGSTWLEMLRRAA